MENVTKNMKEVFSIEEPQEMLETQKIEMSKICHFCLMIVLR